MPRPAFSAPPREQAFATPELYKPARVGLDMRTPHDAFRATMASTKRVESPATQIAGFIAKFDPAIGKLARSARSALRKRLPSAVELVYDNYNALAMGFSTTERASEKFRCRHPAAATRSSSRSRPSSGRAGRADLSFHHHATSDRLLRRETDSRRHA